MFNIAPGPVYTSTVLRGDSESVDMTPAGVAAVVTAAAAAAACAGVLGVCLVLLQVEACMHVIKVYQTVAMKSLMDRETWYGYIIRLTHLHFQISPVLVCSQLLGCQIPDLAALSNL